MVSNDKQNGVNDLSLAGSLYFSGDAGPPAPHGESPRAPWLFGPLRQLAAWFMPPSILERDLDQYRRGQFLVATSFVFILLALVFVLQGISLTGTLTTAWSTLVLCCLLMAVNPFVMRYSGSVRLAGALLTSEIFFCIAFISYLGDGILDAAFLINLVLPWLAATIIGPRASIMVAVAIIAETLLGYKLLESDARWGAMFFGATSAWFWTLGYILVTAAMALMAWVYEGLTFRHLNEKARELERAHRELARGEARFRSLVQKSSDLITLLDRSGNIFYQSPSSARVTGFSQVDLIGRTLFEHLHPDDAERVMDTFERLVNQPGTQVEAFIEPYRFRIASGEWRWLESSATNLLGDPNVNAVVMHTHDFTTHHLAQEELIRAKVEAERLVHTRTTFLASLSHEVRTPLTSIIGFSNVLAGEVTGNAREFATLVAKAGERLLATLNSILDFARLEAEEVEPSWAFVDLVQEAREAVRLLEPLAAEKNLALELQAEQPRITSWVDVAFFHRILNNLIGNAIKFTEEGHVVVRLSADESHVRIDVADTGRGIGKEFLHLLFREFKRERRAGTTVQEGSGLGLPITQRLLDLMDGEISVESTLGVGTTITVRLPREPAEGAPYDPDELEAL